MKRPLRAHAQPPVMIDPTCSTGAAADRTAACAGRVVMSSASMGERRGRDAWPLFCQPPKKKVGDACQGFDRTANVWA